MGKYMSNAVIQKLLLVALGGLIVTIFFMTTAMGNKVSLIETRLDRMETTILENANHLESHEGSLLAVWEAIENQVETDEVLLNAISEIQEAVWEKACLLDQEKC
tara:strand:- start:366 stop:680 length:315 start_codon:yes stop_codon:yes gene_type:complete